MYLMVHVITFLYLTFDSRPGRASLVYPEYIVLEYEYGIVN
jgi:hypothetical protein